MYQYLGSARVQDACDTHPTAHRDREEPAASEQPIHTCVDDVVRRAGLQCTNRVLRDFEGARARSLRRQRMFAVGSNLVDVRTRRH